MKIKIIIFALFSVSYIITSPYSLAQVNVTQATNELEAVTMDANQLEVILYKEEFLKRQAQQTEDRLNDEAILRETNNSRTQEVNRMSKNIPEIYKQSSTTIKPKRKVQNVLLIENKQADKPTKSSEKSR
ncbi:hypothetical protein [Spirosoma validum]|uniref:Secreted protein n=1 Tax=Spirosoma validum TaxID=2771355 RepID=A0A927B2V3_9BACT|nr:hypothetical protein [Spirosoma validum]MBD2754321.1 hypothetical protein [Spirosoma validum]